jgi:hypothetical protein
VSTTGTAFVKLVGEGSGQVKGSAGGQYSSSPKAFALQLIFGPLILFSISVQLIQTKGQALLV